jgi:hypothetical protein
LKRSFTFRVTEGNGIATPVTVQARSGSEGEILVRQLWPGARQVILLRGDRAPGRSGSPEDEPLPQPRGRRRGWIDGYAKELGAAGSKPARA